LIIGGMLWTILWNDAAMWERMAAGLRENDE
jgi:hypothetical protein